MAVFMGVVEGYFYGVVILGIDKHHYLYNAQQFVDNFDLFSILARASFLVSGSRWSTVIRGFTVDAGAEGVGKAATSAFVQSFVLILLLDLLLGISLDSLLLHGMAGRQ